MHFRRKFSRFPIFAVFFFLTGGQCSFAQTTLATGDVSIVGFNAALANRDGFSFVIWTPISAGTVIKFTDNAFNNTNVSTTAGNFRDGEEIITWTSASALPAGTVITIEGNGSATVCSTGSAIILVSSSQTATTYINLGTTGDQIIAYQGTNSPTYAQNTTLSGTALFLLSFQGTGISTTWNSTGTTSGANTYLPTDLSSANVFFASNAVAGEYIGARTGLTFAQYKTAVNNIANWTTYLNPNGVTAYNTTAFSTTPPPSITGQPSNSIICAGGNTAFSVTASNATGYQWQVNAGSGFTNISNGAPYSGATTATLTLTAATAALNGYNYRAIATGVASPSATSNAVTLTVNSPGTWLGTTNGNWSNTANWSCATLPAASTNVSISSSAPAMPVVDITTATCNNITIGSGASLTVSSGKILAIQGTVTNGGVFNANGKAIFDGAAQTIPALTYNDLEIQGTGTKLLAGSVTVNGVLTLTSSYLQLGTSNMTIGNSGSIAGASSSSFIIVTGSGALKQNNIGTGGISTSVLFPIGTNSSSYTPISVLNAGTSDQFSARIGVGVNTSYDVSDIPNGAPETNFNVKKTWYVSEAVAGGSDVTLTFQWNAADETIGFDRVHCFGGHFTGGRWTHGPVNQIASGSDPYTLSLSGINSFSPFGVGSAGSILPVHLSAFTAKRSGNGALIEWKSENEQNLADYTVDKSENGQDYQAIGKVAAINQPGPHGYEFNDAVASNSTVYYRLRQNDIDGTFTYSPVIALAGNNERQVVLLYPNPANDQATLKLNLVAPVKMNFRLLNNTGAMIRKWQEILPAGINYQTIQLKGINAGIYFLEVKGQNETQRITIVKQ